MSQKKTQVADQRVKILNYLSILLHSKIAIIAKKRASLNVNAKSYFPTLWHHTEY